MRIFASVGCSTPKSAYIYQVKAIGQHLAAISSDDSLILLDPTTLQSISSNRTLSSVHNGPTCLEKGNLDDHTLFTAGRDGVIRYWDLRVAESTLKFENDISAPFLSLAVSGQSTRLAGGTELTQSQASIQIWDYRANKLPILQYVESHNDDVTSLAFHPSKSTCLLSGSTDGLVNAYDTNIADEDDALAQVMNHGASISHADFVTHTKVYALSHDETLSLYEMNLPDDSENNIPPVVFGDFRRKVSCQYVVDVLIGSEGVLVGAGTHSEHRLDLIPLDVNAKWALNEAETIRLTGAHGEDIVRSIHLDEQSSAIFTAGEDGFIKAWRSSDKEAGSNELKSKWLKRSTETRKKKNTHFKPY